MHRLVGQHARAADGRAKERGLARATEAGRVDMESISKRGLANEVNGLSVLCLRWKSLKTEDANELPILDRGRRSESAPRFEIRSDN
jgi:hypothetical protein